MTERARRGLAGWGGAALLVGLVYYLSLTHTATLLDGATLGLLSRAGLGAAGGSLPTFLHGLGFSLLTIAVAAPRHRLAVIAICLVWVGIHCVFELLQPGGPWALAAGDAATGPGGRLPWMAAQGRFDWLDVAAAFLAGLAAFALTARLDAPARDPG